MERFRQLGCAQHICDAFQVISHRREADFDLCTGQSAHQQTRMSEDTVLDRRERMLNGGSAEPHRFWSHPVLHPIQRLFI